MKQNAAIPNAKPQILMIENKRLRAIALSAILK
jgi:hypothetical protein